MAVQLGKNLHAQHRRNALLPEENVLDTPDIEQWYAGCSPVHETADFLCGSGDYLLDCPSPQGMNIVKDIECIIHSEENVTTSGCSQMLSPNQSNKNEHVEDDVSLNHSLKSPNLLEVRSPILGLINEDIWQYRPNASNSMATNEQSESEISEKQGSPVVENFSNDRGLFSGASLPVVANVVENFTNDFMQLANQVLKCEIDCSTFHNAGKKLVYAYCSRYLSESNGLVEEHQRLVTLVQQALSLNVMVKVTPKQSRDVPLTYSVSTSDNVAENFVNQQSSTCYGSDTGQMHRCSHEPRVRMNFDGVESYDDPAGEKHMRNASTTTITTSSSLERRRSIIDSNQFFPSRQVAGCSAKDLSIYKSDSDLHSIASFIMNKSPLFQRLSTLQKHVPLRFASLHANEVNHLDNSQTRFSTFAQHQLLAKILLQQHKHGSQLSGAERLYLNRFLTHCKNMGLNVFHDVHSNNVVDASVDKLVATSCHHHVGNSTHTLTTNVNISKKLSNNASGNELNGNELDPKISFNNLIIPAAPPTNPGHRGVIQKIEQLEERMNTIEQILSSSMYVQSSYWLTNMGSNPQEKKLELEECVVQSLLRAPSLSLILCHPRGCLLFAQCLRIFTPKNVESLIVNLLKSLKVILDFSAHNNDCLAVFLWKVMESFCQSMCSLSNSSLSQILDVCWLMPSLLTHEFSSTLLMKVFDSYFRHFLQCARVDEEYFRHHVRKFTSTVMKVDLRYLQAPRADVTGLLQTLSSFMDANVKQAVFSRIQALAGGVVSP